MCGIVGIVGERAAWDVFQGLHTLQHRGQQGAGICSYDKQHGLCLHKELGLVHEAIPEKNLLQLPGNMAIGHTRYATVGRGAKNELQPMVFRRPYGLSLVHNGNVVNKSKLQRYIYDKYAIKVLSNSDLEIIQGLLSGRLEEERHFGDLFSALQKSVETLFEMVHGGYAVTGLIADHGLFGFRDPWGLRPLVFGRKGNSFIFASETRTLEHLGHEYLGDVNPGELIYIDEQSGDIHRYQFASGKGRPCMFEWVYFGGLEGKFENIGVHSVRQHLGAQLASEIRQRFPGELPFDLVTCVPETSRVAAKSLALALGLPYQEVLVKSRYVHRSFILGTQEERDRAVSLKWGPLPHLIEGKRLLFVDDSIVRGTTGKKIVQLVKKLNAKSVSMASTCPPIKYPCYFGVDFPDPQELVMSRMGDVDRVAAYLGVEHLFYLDTDGLSRSIGLGKDKLCMACLNGDYPVGRESAAEFEEERRRQRSKVSQLI